MRTAILSLFVTILFVCYGCSHSLTPQYAGEPEETEEYDTGYEAFNCGARGRFFENPSLDCQIARDREKALAKIDKQECKRNGGTIRGTGMFGMPFCFLKFSDGGTPCSDSSECQGSCTIRDERKPEGLRETASCEFNNDWNACYARVIQGVEQKVECWE